MGTHEAISKTLRFEVFKRDMFACQHCGRKTPDVLLDVNHIEPTSKGGTNDLQNLITSCKECNSGKSDRTLADTTVIDMQREQLEELQKRKEQMEMMFQWQKGLLNLDDDVISELSSYWSEVVRGYSLNESGLNSLRKLKRHFDLDEILVAMKISGEQYLVFHNGAVTKKSVDEAWYRVGGICNIRRQEKDKPYMQRLYYIRGILRNRLSYLNESLALQLLQEAAEANASIESLESHAKSVRNWTQWRNEIEDFISKQKEG